MPKFHELRNSPFGSPGVKLLRLACATFWIFIAVIPAAAQESPPGTPAAPTQPSLEYTGKPIVLPLECTADDIAALGLTCSEDEPCPVFLELTSALAAGDRIWLAGNLHAAAVTMFSTLLVSEDAGRTWREAHPRIRGAALEFIQFDGADTGWVSGELLNPLPSEPFFLLTTDGGKSWRRKPVFDENSENRLGTVQQFYFDGKTSGSLVIDLGQGTGGDRYELYESPNGGESWTIRQSSRTPIKLKRPDPEPATVRIRADGSTQAFQIERRQANRWTPLAAFAVKTGVCKGQ